MIGRWTSQDPLSFRARDLNLYRYSMNSPSMLADPGGESPVVIGIGIGFLLGGALTLPGCGSSPTRAQKLAQQNATLMKDQAYLRMMLREISYKHHQGSRVKHEQQAKTFLDEVGKYPWHATGKGYHAYNGDAIAYTDFNKECIFFNDRYFNKDPYERLVTMLHELYHQYDHAADEDETEKWAQDMAKYIYNNSNIYNKYITQ